MIFVDTWAWVALAWRCDSYHARAVKEHRALRNANIAYVTTDFVMSETISTLFRCLDVTQAEQYVEGLLGSLETGRNRLVYVSPEQFMQAWQMRRQYADKPDISFVDFTSMIVMRDMGLTNVFSGDRHFTQVGLGFCLRP